MTSPSILVAGMADPQEILAVAKEAEAAGLVRFWLAETSGVDVSAVGAMVASETGLEPGTAIVSTYTRTPVLLSMMAATWSALGGGRRVHLGVGAGGQGIVERWHGQDFNRPLTCVADTVAVLRQALAGDRTAHHGDERPSDGFRLDLGAQPDVRVLVGGMGPRMRDLAAREADGLIVTWLSPETVRVFRDDLDRAARDAGRDPSAVALVARVYVAVQDDLENVREQVRRELVEYVMSPPYARYFRSIGYDDEVDAVHAAFSKGDREGTAKGVSDRLLDELVVLGRSADDVRTRLTEYVEAGADDVLVQPVAPSRGGDPRQTVRAVAEAMR